MQYLFLDGWGYGKNPSSPVLKAVSSLIDSKDSMYSPSWKHRDDFTVSSILKYLEDYVVEKTKINTQFLHCSSCVTI